MRSITPFIVLGAVFVFGVILTILGGLVRIFGAAFALVAFVLLIALFIFVPPDE